MTRSHEIWLSGSALLGVAGSLMLGIFIIGLLAWDWRVGFLGPALAALFGSVGLFFKAHRAIAALAKKEEEK